LLDTAQQNTVSERPDEPFIVIVRPITIREQQAIKRDA
jgi:hypothetical protein